MALDGGDGLGVGVEAELCLDHLAVGGCAEGAGGDVGPGAEGVADDAADLVDDFDLAVGGGFEARFAITLLEFAQGAECAGVEVDFVAADGRSLRDFANGQGDAVAPAPARGGAARFAAVAVALGLVGAAAGGAEDRFGEGFHARGGATAAGAPPGLLLGRVEGGAVGVPTDRAGGGFFGRLRRFAAGVSGIGGGAQFFGTDGAVPFGNVRAETA